MAADKIQRTQIVKQKIVTGTTAANGALNLSTSVAGKNFVIGAVCIDESAIYIAKLVRSTSGSQWVYVQNALSGAAVANTSVTVSVYYIHDNSGAFS